jgi:hypothetical protein
MPKGHTDDAKIGPGEYEHAGSSVGDLRDRFLFIVRRDTPQVMEALRKLDGSESALLAWAADWHLQDAWIMDVARRTLLDWRAHPAIAKGLHWARANQAGELVPEPPAVRWEPTLESAAEFLSRVQNEYVPNVRRWATAMGLVGTPQKPKLTRDLSALVQYHVKGDDLDAVADEFFGDDGNEDTARKAITNLAKLMGLTLRK